MDKLIKEISTIVSQYGTDIVTEERFVNILKDLYPDRDHPEKFDILRALINDGISSEMIATVNANNAKSNVEKRAKVLSAKSGYSQQDISQILYCLCIGCNCISIDDYNAIVKPNSPKPSPSKQKGNPKRKPASKRRPQPIKPVNPITIRNKIEFALAILGFCLMPVLCFSLFANGWWPFFVVAALALYEFIIILIIVMIDDDEHIYSSNNSPNPKLVGGYCLIAILSSIFLIVIPFLPETNSWHPISFILNLVLAGANGAFGIGIASEYFGNGVESHNKLSFIRGFTVSLLIIMTILGTVYFVPDRIRSVRSYFDLKRYEADMKLAENVRHTRDTQKKELSFMGFHLGDSIGLCTALLNASPIHSIQKRHYLNEDLKHKELLINNIDYSGFIDTVLYADSKWDNASINLHLFFHANRLMAIEMVNRHELDSLLYLYSQKYGEPECIPQRMYEYFPESGIESQGNINHKEYLWTFLNGIIQITNDDSYSSSVWYVRYFDRHYETVMKNKLEEKERQRIESQKQDSIRKLRIEADEERQRIQEDLNKKENHRNAMNQI